VATDAPPVGKSYPPVTYEVGVEKIREYAAAVGEGDAIYHDREAAREAGFRDVVAPPMFAVVYCARAMGPAIFDPEIGIDFSRLLHGGQEFAWSEPVCAGDGITTTVSLKDFSERDGRKFYVFESVSANADGDEVSRGIWTNVVRGG
jgi:acyl dehydratase